MTSIPHWNKQPAFQSLCNIIVSNRLVCLTGAGISLDIKRKSDLGRSLPSWLELVQTLRTKFPLTNQKDNEDVDLLLAKDAPGDWLIEAATIIRKNNPSEFDAAVRQAVEATDDPDGATSKTHRAIAALKPRGIMTFNYDLGHEKSWSDAERKLWRIFTPRGEDQMLELMRTSFASPFLLKAHGSLSDAEDRLVLDFESYRALLAKSPTYRAFVGWLLTHFNLLIVGFGMSDPDFDEFMRLISVEVGGPVREHVLLTKAREETANHVLLRRRYGISSLRVSDWSEIPEVISDALKEPGTHARKTIDECTSEDTALRKDAHLTLQQLSEPGRRVVSQKLRRKIEQAIEDRDVRAASELIYSLGKIGLVPENKELLYQVLEDPSNEREIVAHAALALEGKLEAKDTCRLEALLAKYVPAPRAPDNPEFPDPDNRIPIYLAYLIAQNRRRTAEDDKAKAKEPMPFVVTVAQRAAKS